MPNNRQWATIIWVALILILVLARKDLRSSVRDVCRAAATPKILLPLVVLVGWVVALLAAASRVGLWNTARVTDTVFWVATTGLILFGSFDKVSKEAHFVRRTALATLTAGAFVAVFTEVYVLGLVAELLLLPLVTFLAILSAVSGRNPEHHQIKRLVDLVMAMVGIAVLVYVVVKVISEWRNLDTVDVVQQLALPIWLTIGILPYIYVVGLLAAYEMAFMRINLAADKRWWERTRAKVALASILHAQALRLGELPGQAQLQLAHTSSVGEARRVIRDALAARDEAQREAEALRQRLLDMAGVDGVDEHGRRLDRREFEETTRALQWVGTCHMGHYRNLGRYRTDLLDFALDGFGGRDLPNPHGVEMRVSGDGQKWMAWRQTVTGWVFAIGAAGPPPDQWVYDGPRPPHGFPGDYPGWGSGPFSNAASPNW